VHQVVFNGPHRLAAERTGLVQYLVLVDLDQVVAQDPPGEGISRGVQLDDRGAVEPWRWW